MKLHFISGLPWSGSALLAGLLRQNPRFHAAMTGPVASIVDALLGAFQATNETAVFLDEARRRAILKAAVEAYHAPQADRDVIFDTNRAWCARLPLLRALWPEARVIACVRDVDWIMDSFERLVRRNAFEPSRLFVTREERATVYSRTEALAHRYRVVGFAWSALKEAHYGEHSDALLLVEYDLLTQKPEACLRLIYQWLGEPWFEHDVTNVDYDEPEFDRALGAPGQHRVRREVGLEARATVLSPDFVAKFAPLAFFGATRRDQVPTGSLQPTRRSDRSATEVLRNLCGASQEPSQWFTIRVGAKRPTASRKSSVERARFYYEQGNTWRLLSTFRL